MCAIHAGTNSSGARSLSTENGIRARFRPSSTSWSANPSTSIRPERNDPMSAAAGFIKARDFLLAHRADQDFACRHFRWPQMEEFNWAVDYFDEMATGNNRPALHVLDENGAGTILTFADLSSRSNRVARY